jgi:hypothetical protein
MRCASLSGAKQYSLLPHSGTINQQANRIAPVLRTGDFFRGISKMTLQHGFKLIREQEIAEYKTQARLYRHEKTGAELLSLINEDENKVFGITFRTTPKDSTGVAHIMEHCVLNGSRKYPVKEPFVELIKGSLNTFLNAIHLSR